MSGSSTYVDNLASAASHVLWASRDVRAAVRPHSNGAPREPCAALKSRKNLLRNLAKKKRVQLAEAGCARTHLRSRPPGTRRRGQDVHQGAASPWCHIRHSALSAGRHVQSCSRRRTLSVILLCGLAEVSCEGTPSSEHRCSNVGLALSASSWLEVAAADNASDGLPDRKDLLLGDGDSVTLIANCNVDLLQCPGPSPAPRR